jgi:uncharacterized membrane protein YphA (DoxX/SURF4 family)
VVVERLELIRFAVQVALGCILLFTSATKLTELTDFIKALGSYRIVSKHFVSVLTLFVVVCEAAVGLGMLTGLFFRAAALAASLLFLSFSFAMNRMITIIPAVNVREGRSVSVGGNGLGQNYHDNPEKKHRIRPKLVQRSDPPWILSLPGGTSATYLLRQRLMAHLLRIHT